MKYAKYYAIHFLIRDINQSKLLYSLIPEGSPTVFSIRENHSPMRVLSTISLPDLRYLIGLKTPNTARSAKFGLDPPVNKCYNYGPIKKVRTMNLRCKVGYTEEWTPIQGIDPCLSSIIKSCTFICYVIFLLQFLWHKVHCRCSCILCH